MEAHTQDTWPLGQHVCVNAHKTIEDRINVASQFIEAVDWKLETVVDNMDNTFLFDFKAHPERFYVVVDGKMAFKAYPENAYYHVSDMKDWLVGYFS